MKSAVKVVNITINPKNEKHELVIACKMSGFITPHYDVKSITVTDKYRMIRDITKKFELEKITDLKGKNVILHYNCSGSLEGISDAAHNYKLDLTQYQTIK